jgi:hypothetical protein
MDRITEEQHYRGTNTLAACGLEELFSSCAVVSGFCSGGKSASADYHFTFYLPYYLEGTDDGQKTPPGHPDFYSYVKVLCVFICRTDRITDGETNTLATRGPEELFFRCLRKVSPAPQCSECIWYIVLEFCL